jgi:hypothetical protein
MYPVSRVAYELFPDPGSGSTEGSTYQGIGSGRVALEVNEDRQRLYLLPASMEEKRQSVTFRCGFTRTTLPLSRRWTSTLSFNGEA